MMQSYLLKSLTILLTLFTLCFVINGCRDDDDEPEEETSKLHPDVDTPAYPILLEANSLHIFTVQDFFEDKINGTYGNIFKDRMELFIDNFTPAQSTEEPDDDADILSSNDLGYTRSIWTEVSNSEKDALLYAKAWEVDNLPLRDSRYTQNDREYRILTNGVLQQSRTSDYMPLYEVIDKNIYEKRQEVVFTWDFGGAADVDAKEDVSRDDIDDWETIFINRSYTILPYASIWGDDYKFSEGAIIYGATRSIAKDILVIEAVYNNEGNNNKKFTIEKAKISSGANDITTALAPYSSDNNASVHLNYQFTEDFFSHHSVFLQFDTLQKQAHLFTTNNASDSDKIKVPYIEHYDKSYIEIDLSSLTKSQLDGLNIPAYFNPIIAGPFGDDNDFYYGKHYIKTDDAQRLKLEPVFFLNNIAKNDVAQAFENWRSERHEEEK